MSVPESNLGTGSFAVGKMAPLSMPIARRYVGCSSVIDSPAFAIPHITLNVYGNVPYGTCMEVVFVHPGDQGPQSLTALIQWQMGKQ